MTQINNTPLEIALWYVGAGDSPPPLAHPLEASNGELSLLGDIVLSLLPINQQTQAQAALETPLDAIFNNTWNGILSNGTPQQMIQQAVKSARSNAYNISADFPPSGSLDASVSSLSQPAVFGLPASWTGQLLTLKYALDGAVTLIWSETTSGVLGAVFGSLLDPSYQATFDGTLIVDVSVPFDPRVGLGVSATFQTANIQTGINGFSLGNVLEVMHFALETGWDFLTFQSLPPNTLPNRDVAVASADVSSSFTLLSLGFALGATQGFSQLSVHVSETVQAGWPAVNRVEFDLTHSFDPGPVSMQSGPYGVFGSGTPQIGANPGVVNAGSQCGILGANLPAQTTQLTISWLDTTSGPVAKSEVEWGKVLPTAPGQPLSVDVSGDTTINRSGPNDNQNSFTIGNLVAGVRYAFRVRDYDLFGQAVTAWGEWSVMTTTATDQVALVLGDATNTLLGTATVLPDGIFAADVVVPASTPPGLYALWAEMAGHQVASASIRVIAAGAPLPAQLEVFDPATGIAVAGVAGAIGDYALSVRANDFQSGAVALLIDTLSGMHIGSATANAAGRFTTTLTWPNGVDGAHSIVAVQAGHVVASVAVYGSNTPS
jgi:hypothetical protein